jgi:hypothetical protein
LRVDSGEEAIDLFPDVCSVYVGSGVYGCKSGEEAIAEAGVVDFYVAAGAVVGIDVCSDAITDGCDKELVAGGHRAIFVDGPGMEGGIYHSAAMDGVGMKGKGDSEGKDLVRDGCCVEGE